MHTTNKKMQQLHTNRTLSSSINKTNTNHIKHSIYKSPIRLPSHFLQQTNSLTDHSTNEMICIYWLFLFDSHKISKTQHFSHQLEVDTVKMGIGNYIITSEILEIFECQTKLLESTASIASSGLKCEIRSEADTFTLAIFHALSPMNTCSSSSARHWLCYQRVVSLNVSASNLISCLGPNDVIESTDENQI